MADTSSAENPYGGLEVPAPAPDEPILRLVNAGNEMALSLNDLREFSETRETVFEPFVKQNIEFVGVSMEELFREAGIKDSDLVLTVALNEYVYSNLAGEFVATEAFVAYEQAGAQIPMSRGGPIRIIVPNGTPLAANLDVWNWSLAEIRVE